MSTKTRATDFLAKCAIQERAMEEAKALILDLMIDLETAENKIADQEETVRRLLEMKG